MLTLIFLFLVMVGLIVFLTIFDGKVIAGGVIGYFLAKWLNKREDNK